MWRPPNIDARGRTFRELLDFLRTFGPRYRVWKGKSSKTALFPHEVLNSLGALDPVLEQACEVRMGAVTVEKRALYVWHVYCFPHRASRSPGLAKPSSYFIEDLLADWRVRDWLRQQVPDQGVAVLPRTVGRSTFLQIYYLDVLGYIPEHLETARLPLWCVYLEEFIHGLAAQQQLPSVVVSARTIDALLGLLATVCADVQGEPGLDLNDGEYGWEEEKKEGSVHST